MCVTFKASEMGDTNVFFHGEPRVKKSSSAWWNKTKACDKNNWKRLAVAVTTKSKNHCFLFSPRAVIGFPCQDQENNKNNYNTFMRVPGNCTKCRWFWNVNFKTSVVGRNFCFVESLLFAANLALKLLWPVAKNRNTRKCFKSWWLCEKWLCRQQDIRNWCQLTVILSKCE